MHTKSNSVDGSLACDPSRFKSLLVAAFEVGKLQNHLARWLELSVVDSRRRTSAHLDQVWIRLATESVKATPDENAAIPLNQAILDRKDSWKERLDFHELVSSSIENVKSHCNSDSFASPAAVEGRLKELIQYATSEIAATRTLLENALNPIVIV